MVEILLSKIGSDRKSVAYAMFLIQAHPMIVFACAIWLLGHAHVIGSASKYDYVALYCFLVIRLPSSGDICFTANTLMYNFMAALIIDMNNQ